VHIVHTGYSGSGWQLLLLHGLYSANFEDRVRGAGVAIGGEHD